MARKIRNQLRTLLTLLLFVMVITGFSQTKNDAIAAYNEGVHLLKTDPQGALAAFDKCIDICNSLGDEGEETKVMASIQIPGLHYNLAMESYKAKNYAEAIEKFQKTAEVAGTYNNDQVKSKAENIIPQLYYIQGNNISKTDDLDKALESYNKAIEYNPSYTKAYLGKGLIYRKKNDIENMKETMDRVIEFGLNTNDTKSVETAEQVIRNTYFNEAVKNLEAKNLDAAENALKVSIEYGNESVDAFYQLGKIYNTKKNWEEALKNLNKSIELETGDDTTKAKLYYELATTYVGQGNTDAACDAYKNAAFGQYAENAKYQIDHVLKCE